MLPNSQLHYTLESEVSATMALPNGPFEPISRSEVLTAIYYLKSNQSPGTDGCPAEWLKSRGSQLLPRVYEILVILASKYMDLMGDSRASVRDSALILASVAAPSDLILRK